MKFQITLFLFLFGIGTTFSQKFTDAPTSVAEIQAWVNENLLQNSTKVLDSIITRPLDNPSVVISRQIYQHDLLARQTLYQFESYPEQNPTEIQFGSQIITDYEDQAKIEVDLFWEDGWKIDDRHTDSLDANGLLLARLNESWNDMMATFEAEEWIVYNYRSGTDLLEERLTYRWANGEWKRYRRILYTYDAQDVLELEELYEPQGLEDWSPIERKEKSYDALGNLTVELTYVWDELEMDFLLNSSWNYWYGGDELLDSTNFKTNLIGPMPFGFSIAYAYEAELLKNFTTYTWDPNTDIYTPSQAIEYTHDAEDDISQVKGNLFDLNSGQAIAFTLADYYYSTINVATQELNQAPAFVCQTANPHSLGQAITCQTDSDQIAPTSAHVYDLQGRLHWSQTLAPQTGSWDIYLTTELPSGLYFLVWENPRGVLGQQKLLIP